MGLNLKDAPNRTPFKMRLSAVDLMMRKGYCDHVGTISVYGMRSISYGTGLQATSTSSADGWLATLEYDELDRLIKWMKDED